MKKILLISALLFLMTGSIFSQCYDGITQPTKWRFWTPVIFNAEADGRVVNAAPFMGYKVTLNDWVSVTPVVQYNIGQNNLIPQVLFPSNATIAAKWFKLIQHNAQDYFVKKYDLDLIILGRRKLDTNYTGKAGENIYTNRKGITRYSPLDDWSHEHVMAVIAYYMNADLPPNYYWPNGWVVGTGCWPARQWTGSVFNAWKEIYIIDKSIVHKAANYLPSAKQFLQKIGS